MGGDALQLNWVLPQSDSQPHSNTLQLHFASSWWWYSGAVQVEVEAEHGEEWFATWCYLSSCKVKSLSFHCFFPFSMIQSLVSHEKRSSPSLRSLDDDERRGFCTLRTFPSQSHTVMWTWLHPSFQDRGLPLKKAIWEPDFLKICRFICLAFRRKRWKATFLCLHHSALDSWYLTHSFVARFKCMLIDSNQYLWLFFIIYYLLEKNSKP